MTTEDWSEGDGVDHHANYSKLWEGVASIYQRLTGAPVPTMTDDQIILSIKEEIQKLRALACAA